jgi:hypothetical protein
MANGVYYNPMSPEAQQAPLTLGQQIGNRVTDLRGKGRQFIDQNNALFNRSNLLGGATLLPGALMATQSVVEGRPLEAAAGGASSIAAGGLAAAVTGGLRQSKNPLARVAGYALPALAGGAAYGVGGLAEEVKAGMTGKPITGREGSSSEQRGRTRKQAELELEMRGNALDQNLQFYQQYTGYIMNAEREQLQKLMPLIQKDKDLSAIRQQALMNTQGQNYAMLGTLSTAGKLATGAQEQTGATLRTALTSNPYANSVLQAPNISFG